MKKYILTLAQRLTHMTTLQAFKSKFVLGARCAFRAAWCPVATVRTVTDVQRLGAGLTHPTKPGNSFLDWPKAADVTQPEPDLFLVMLPNPGSKLFVPVLVYDFRPEKIAAAKQPSPLTTTTA